METPPYQGLNKKLWFSLSIVKHLIDKLFKAGSAHKENCVMHSL
jgi:hypothetical protein